LDFLDGNAIPNSAAGWHSAEPACQLGMILCAGPADEISWESQGYTFRLNLQSDGAAVEACARQMRSVQPATTPWTLGPALGFPGHNEAVRLRPRCWKPHFWRPRCRLCATFFVQARPKTPPPGRRAVRSDRRWL